MARPFTILTTALAAATLAGTPAFARHVHHRSYLPARVPVPGGDPYWQAAVIARLTAQAQTEPGLTSDFAPEARQTATGGPSGGIPGYSGGD